jgi:hypothetical protein
VNEQRAREGVEHLQSAALEVIAAVRAFLDVAEEVVRDPAQAAVVVHGFAEAGRRATGDAPDVRNADDEAAGVTRIRVS